MCDTKEAMRQGRENAEAIARLEKKIDDIYEIINSARGFFKVVGFIGKGVLWVSGILAAIATIIHFGGHRG
jgi:hypothetical protein